MTIRLDKIVHSLPRFYRLKCRLLCDSRQFLYRIVGIKKYVNTIAKLYTEKREKIFLRFFTGKMILDIGCGRGEFMNSLKENYSCDCVGLDISINMLFYAKKNNTHHEFVGGTSNFLPFADNSVEVVVFNNVFHHLPADVQRKTLEESKRVAKEIVMIDDVLNWENKFKRFLANLYWKITDGGYKYRTEIEWNELLKNEILLDYNIGTYLMRHCYFVIDAKSS